MREPVKPEIKFVGDKKVELASLIYVLKVRNLIKKRHIAYLAHVIDTQGVKTNLKSVPIVCEYLNVFLEEMKGFPPKREVEFTFEVVPGTTTDSQTPYRMAPSELKELKDQLEELLEKGYI